MVQVTVDGDTAALDAICQNRYKYDALMKSPRLVER